ncbi:MAG: class I SAM-dependent methyltransferase [Beijerinckiaceae bacterium]|nr:class I SAM-dependent methyltransferase [Beijerinckiaceae bacterium]MCI0734901.1 class I SAM-dependent methyltransferase [Beijerinckiaceae bacterium]
MIIWQSEDAFEIDNVRFKIDMRPGNLRAPSSDEAFTFVKSRRVVNVYRQLERFKPKGILELGLFQGGSIVFFEKLFQPERLAGIELSKSPIPALDRYIARGSVIRAYYGVSQADRPRVEEIIRNEFPEGLDLVIDDASHHYDFSKTSFEICFPFLRPGGLYVLEDWPWSHRAPYQPNTHPWHGKPALTNLVFELVVSVAGPSSIAKLEVYPDLAVITKTNVPAFQNLPVLNAGSDRLRGRSLQPI